MNTPEENEVLTAESVKLLVKGDVLRRADGSIVTLAADGLPDASLGEVFIGRPDSEGWIPWSGGENPVPGQMVEVCLASGESYHKVALSDDYGRWWHVSGGQDHIIAFRLSPPKDDETSPEGSVPARQDDEAAGQVLAAERDAFESWYCADAAMAGLTFMPAELRAIRDGDSYGKQRVALNSKWEAWAARSSRPHPVAAEGEGAGLREPIGPDSFSAEGKFFVAVDHLTRMTWRWGESCGIDNVGWDETGDSYNQTCRAGHRAARHALVEAFHAAVAEKTGNASDRAVGISDPSSEMKPIPPTTQERIAELEAGIRGILDATYSFTDESGDEVAGQVRVRCRNLLFPALEHREES